MRITDLSAWESFYWVAHEKSFTAAAKRLKVGLPLISKRIAALETDLGTRLFQRTTRKVGLTQDGKSLLPKVELFLKDAADLEEGFENTQELIGTIRLTCVTAFAHRVLPPIIAKFCERHPKIRFDLEITDTPMDLIDHQIDLAIRVQEPEGADFVFKLLMPNDLVVCASPQYLKKAKKPVRTPRDLLSHPLLTLKLYEDCKFKGSEIRVRDLLSARKVICESGLFLTELATQGQGIAIRSVWDIGPSLKSGKLVQILGDYPLDAFGNMYAIIPNRRLVSARVRAFMDFLQKAMR